MRWRSSLTVLFLGVFIGSAITTTVEAEMENGTELEVGIDVLMEEEFEKIEGKNVGLITNPTGRNSEQESTVDVIYEEEDVNLVSLYGPEHGVRGDAQAGEYIEYYEDDVTGLPVYSLYGETEKPTPEMLEDVEVLLFDIQDIGIRFYTYIYTMAYAMEAAGEQNIPFIVLDRPNPLGGEKVEGPVLEEGHESFIGLYPIALRHGMTVGELADYFNEEFGFGEDLSVVEMNNWERSDHANELDRLWIPPSPNIPTEESAFVYPGAALIEGTNISEGRGTTQPFTLLGAPFIDSTELSQELNAIEMEGVYFTPASFTPTFSKFEDELSHGVQLHLIDEERLDSVEMGLHIVKTIHDLYEQFEFQEENEDGQSFFDLLIGNDFVRHAIKDGMAVEEMMASWEAEVEEFKETRAEYLLYEADEDSSTGLFTDYDASDWGYEAVVDLYHQGLIEGDATGAFRPDDLVTRVEASIFLTRALDLPIDETMTVSFADVNESTPHYEEIIAAAEAGIFSGSTTNYFHGERELRREEAAAIFVRSFDFTGGTLSSSFTDIEGRPFAEEIMALCEAGIIEGVNEAEFAPEQTVTRREFALMLSRALEAAH